MTDQMYLYIKIMFYENQQHRETNNKKRIQEQIHHLNMFCYEGFWVIFITYNYTYIKRNYFKATWEVTK